MSQRNKPPVARVEEIFLDRAHNIVKPSEASILVEKEYDGAGSLIMETVWSLERVRARA